MHATIASTQSVVLPRRAGPAQRRTRPAPIVAMAASKTEGAPKKAKASDERRRAPAAVATAAAAIVASTVASPLAAYSADLISEFNASGIIFKDAVQVEALRDPMVDGVTIYLSDFKRSFSAKAQSGDFFSEPSQTALACVRSESAAGVSVKGDVTGFQGQEVFSERKNLNLLNNKTLRVRRIYDQGNNALVYVSYSTRTSSSSNDGGPSAGQYHTNICTVPLRPGEAPGAAAAAGPGQ